MRSESRTVERIQRSRISSRSVSEMRHGTPLALNRDESR